jgi:anaphase-promoting complex subunit 3
MTIPFPFVNCASCFIRCSVDSDEALFLLATCYHRSGKPQSAHALLAAKGYPTVRCRYLAAECCVQLNKYVFASSDTIICK